MRHLLFFVLAWSASIGWAQSRAADPNPHSNPEIFTTQEMCESADYTLWVPSPYMGTCIRYYPSSDLTDAEKVIVYVNADVLSSSKWHNKSWHSGLITSIIKTQKEWERKTDIPNVMIGRPGMLGSSGDERDKRSFHAVDTMRRAVEMLKERYHIKTIAVTSQGGGSSVVAGMLTLGLDTPCWVGASGGYDVQKNHRDVYNAYERYQEAKVNPARRLFLVASENDQLNSYHRQLEYARRLHHQGHNVTALTVHGSGDKGTQTDYVGRMVAGMCLQGQSTAEIVTHAMNASSAQASSDGKEPPSRQTHQPTALACMTPGCVSSDSGTPDVLLTAAPE